MVIPDKNYFRIGEVSKILGVEPYVVRYWESEFRTVRPVRTRSDQRLYRKKDVEQLLTIKNLLYGELFTIAGARKKLTDINRGESSSADEGGRLIDIKRKLREVREIIG
ncbi:MAG: MerR family transcriptional regulator [Deltaproteobacteria bacterium]|nr:MerR family transcriptional regulator [Deltaproteobacteria bacterium]MBW2594652.1 MerR family transcriptional regulator [Deltaproteobacteria bacterium]MBW2649498.1 MerR family transcriptional regulator [Deltaproteobacteria bacterium]